MAAAVVHVVALFGLGRAGTIHFHNIRASQRAVLKFIIDAETERVQRTVNNYNMGSYCTVLTPDEVQKAWDDSSVDCVIISSPTFMHEEQITDALKHDRAVFCEKPLAQDLEKTILLYKLAKEKNKPLHCSFNRRFDPSFKQIQKRAIDGEVGQLLTVKTTSRDSPFPPISYLKISGGFFHDCAVHDLDIVMWVTQEVPAEVFVFGSVFHPELAEIQDSDNCVIVLRFQSGVVASIDISRYSTYGYDQRLEVHGIEGMLQCKNQHKSSVQSWGTSGLSESTLHHSFPQRFKQGYIDSLDHFFDLVEGTVEPIITEESTVNVCRLAEFCEKSWRTGKPVKVEI